MKKFISRLIDLDRTLFRAIFRIKWEPFTRLMRVFTIAGKMGALWGVIAALRNMANNMYSWINGMGGN